MTLPLGRLWRDRLSLTDRLVLGSGLALVGCAAALLYFILRSEINDHRITLRERLDEEMRLVTSAISGPAVVGGLHRAPTIQRRHQGAGATSGQVMPVASNSNVWW